MSRASRKLGNVDEKIRKSENSNQNIVVKGEFVKNIVVKAKNRSEGCE